MTALHRLGGPCRILAGDLRGFGQRLEDLAGGFLVGRQPGRAGRQPQGAGVADVTGGHEDVAALLYTQGGPGFPDEVGVDVAACQQCRQFGRTRAHQLDLGGVDVEGLECKAGDVFRDRAGDDAEFLDLVDGGDVLARHQLDVGAGLIGHGQRTQLGAREPHDVRRFAGTAQLHLIGHQRIERLAAIGIGLHADVGHAMLGEEFFIGRHVEGREDRIGADPDDDGRALGQGR
ncbi:hypothetical protein J2S30_005282 [Herbaspirillum rubrisubalbicans]|nr:hypothetical protein [Herbaspirillum rubrisubalbicans]